MNNVVENIQSQMRKGILEYCILAIIKRQEVYPGDIAAELNSKGLSILEGTLYPLLTRLKNAGYLDYRWEESVSGPPRKYFRLTESGDTFFKALEDTWESLSKAVQSITQ